MPLFIDRLPLRPRTVLSAGRRVVGWYPLLPAILTEPEVLAPAAGASPRWWKFDTGCALDATAWRFHLESAGLDPAARGRLDNEKARIRAANDTVEGLPIRWGMIWLVSNIPGLRHAPFPMDLSPGLPFYDRSPRRTTDLYPLLGIGACRRSRLTVKIDFDAGTLSVWTPGAWYKSVSRFVRRLPGGFATIPPDQLCAAW